MKETINLDKDSHMIKSSNQRFELTEEHIEAFYREGYFMAPSFISEEAVSAINTAYDAEMITLKGEREWQSLPFAKEAQQTLQTECVITMMESLLGGPIQLWLGMYAVVMPGGKGLEWHQDNQYTHILGHMCNAFVALDDINTENAGLWIAPRSHRLGRQPNLNEGDGHRRAATPDNAMSVPPMKRGDAVIFHRETLHHSKENKTDKPRRAFAFQVSAMDCRFAETGKLIEKKDQ